MSIYQKIKNFFSKKKPAEVVVVPKSLTIEEVNKITKYIKALKENDSITSKDIESLNKLNSYAAFLENEIHNAKLILGEMQEQLIQYAQALQQVAEQQENSEDDDYYVDDEECSGECGSCGKCFENRDEQKERHSDEYQDIFGWIYRRR